MVRTKVAKFFLQNFKINAQYLWTFCFTLCIGGKSSRRTPPLFVIVLLYTVLGSVLSTIASARENDHSKWRSINRLNMGVYMTPIKKINLVTHEWIHVYKLEVMNFSDDNNINSWNEAINDRKNDCSGMANANDRAWCQAYRRLMAAVQGYQSSAVSETWKVMKEINTLIPDVNDKMRMNTDVRSGQEHVSIDRYKELMNSMNEMMNQTYRHKGIELKMNDSNEYVHENSTRNSTGAKADILKRKRRIVSPGHYTLSYLIGHYWLGLADTEDLKELHQFMVKALDVQENAIREIAKQSQLMVSATQLLDQRLNLVRSAMGTQAKTIAHILRDVRMGHAQTQWLLRTMERVISAQDALTNTRMRINEILVAIQRLSAGKLTPELIPSEDVTKLILEIQDHLDDVKRGARLAVRTPADVYRLKTFDYYREFGFLYVILRLPIVVETENTILYRIYNTPLLVPGNNSLVTVIDEIFL